jgi:hypothetical protein
MPRLALEKVYQPFYRKILSLKSFLSLTHPRVICLSTIMIAFTFSTNGDSTRPWAWGTSSDGSLKLGSRTATSKATILNAWLANTPQVLLSFCYINLNMLCTSMATSREWNGLATSRKGLRVTEPRSEQRSTYFLQLPHKWAVPLVVVSGTLHWLLSQTFFLVRIDTFNREGQRLDGTSKSACGISYSSLVTFVVIDFVLIGAVRWVGHRVMRPKLPPADSCSLVISAACHPPASEIDPHLKKVRWGVVEQELIEGYEHCSLSSKSVRLPEVSKTYY